MSRIEPMNRRKTSNIQHPTSNNQWFPIGPLIGGWVLDVGCWMFDVPKGSWGEPERGPSEPTRLLPPGPLLPRREERESDGLAKPSRGTKLYSPKTKKEL